MEQARVIIVGGGVVGCAIAAEVSKNINDVFILEELSQIGMVTSSRNSGVVHSGIYYPTNSLKARHCVEGNRLTFEFAASHNVPTTKCGKLIVAATSKEEAELEDAKWFKIDDLPNVPPKLSISGQLISNYLEDRSKL